MEVGDGAPKGVPIPQAGRQAGKSLLGQAAHFRVFYLWVHPPQDQPQAKSGAECSLQESVLDSSSLAWNPASRGVRRTGDPPSWQSRAGPVTANVGTGHGLRQVLPKLLLLPPEAEPDQAWWFTLVIPALGRPRQRIAASLMLSQNKNSSLNPCLAFKESRIHFVPYW